MNTLQEVAQEIARCTDCPLSKSRRVTVPGEGPEDAPLVFIGEGPGFYEDQEGRPFVGPAGRFLEQLVASIGMDRTQVFITNVVKCRPPGNRNPAPDEVASCRPILQRQIELLNPRLIVTLGNVPLKALNPNAGGITRERGRVFTYQKWQVLPTFHPSYLLRKPGEIDLCWKDFRLAMETAYHGSAREGA